VFALGYRTWGDGLSVGYAFSPDRISVCLREDRTIPYVLLADPYRSRLGRLARARLQPPPFAQDPSRQLLRPYRWRWKEPTERPEAVRTLRRLDRVLRAKVVAGETVLVTCHPVLAAVADKNAWRDVAFYAYDDFRGLPGSWQLVQWAHETLAARDVNVVAVTEGIVSAIGAPRSAVVPNGIVATEYDGLGAVPDWFAALPGRVALYAGSLQHRIDVAALMALARDLTDDWTIVLVGPMQSPDWFRELEEQRNVVIRGAEPRHRVLSMMADADVCLVPHLPETEGMSPLKVYEYLGAGTPVVATDLAPMRGLSPRCLLVRPGESLAPAVERAAALPPATCDEVAAFRVQHDWGSRYRDWRKVVLGY
jgi:teichuronic acid biosynthesis glycosyltransferase TuaH